MSIGLPKQQNVSLEKMFKLFKVTLPFSSKLRRKYIVTESFIKLKVSAAIFFNSLIFFFFKVKNED